jgi:2-oxoisovalerate dehydrogenase E1 component beta subunit
VETLEREGLSVEVVDLRTLLPLDREALHATAKKTGRVLVYHEAQRTGGIGGEISAILAEECFEWLDAPILRVTAPDSPVPYSPPLEAAFLPGTEALLTAARRLAAY